VRAAGEEAVDEPLAELGLGGEGGAEVQRLRVQSLEPDAAVGALAHAGKA
jgi:hypothetical protein